MKRKSKYRKHVETSILEDLPVPEGDEVLVVVVGQRGGNLVEVKPIKDETNEGISLCMLPSKFRKLVWVRRGTVLIASRALDDYETAKKEKGKVKYTVNHILFQDQIKHLIKTNHLTQQDINKVLGIEDLTKQIPEISISSTAHKSANSSDSDNLDDIFVNRNRVSHDICSSESDSDTDS